MLSNKMKLAGKAAGSLAIAVALMASAAGVASASTRSDARFNHHNVASSRVSKFLYARIGQGGLVTAVTSTTVTVDRWDGKITTYTITPTTTFTEGSLPTTAASLVVGDRINIRLARSAPTTALKINIELAELAGNVSSVVGDLITITGPQGFARAILVSDSTTFMMGGQPATLADVTVGTPIFAKGTIDPNLTTLDALLVRIGSTVHQLVYHGLVTTITDNSVTLNRLNGTAEMFTTTPSTQYTQGKNVLSAASLVVGDKVNLDASSASPTTATRIDILLAELAGRVTAVSGNSLTILAAKGFSRAITVSPTTVFTMGGQPATLANVTVGSFIVAQGLIDADLTTLDATRVFIRATGHAVTYHGVVSGLTTTSVTVNRNDGKTTIFTITPSTIITEGSASMTVPSLAIGDTVNVQVNSTDPTTALRIDIVQATLSGPVTAISGDTITVTGGQGFARQILVSATTSYTMGGQPATLADVTVGSHIVAIGTIDVNKTTLDATSITIKASAGHAETIHGLVTAVTATSFTLNRSNGKTTIFTITPTTTFSEGSTVLTLAALVTGDSANVDVNSSAPTTAISVDILLATLGGRVTAISGDTITITGGKGFARNILVSTTTIFTQGGAPATLANVTVGSFITAQGLVDPDLVTLDAATITIGK